MDVFEIAPALSSEPHYCHFLHIVRAVLCDYVWYLALGHVCVRVLHICIPLQNRMAVPFGREVHFLACSESFSRG